MCKQSNGLGLCFASNGNAVNDEVAKHSMSRWVTAA